jgi:hypothetical protein
VKVTFRKTGNGRYGVFVQRDHAPALVMHPAPGFDEFLPHDLLHFVGEAEWGLDGAVFGQLAAGGDAGTFWPADQELLAKAMRRRKRRRRGSPRGRRSELIAAILERAWAAQHGRARLPSTWEDELAAARVDRRRLAAVVASLDELAERWHGLRIGESMTLEWPRPERRPHRRSHRAT